MSKKNPCAHFSRQNYTGEELAELELAEMMKLHHLRKQLRSANAELMAQHAADTNENARLLIENQKLKAQLEKQNLSHDDLCRLSRCFHSDNRGDCRYDQDRRINDWLKVQIMNAENREKEVR